MAERHVTENINSYSKGRSEALLRDTPLQQVWDTLAYLLKLKDIAQTHRGIEYNIPFEENQTTLIADIPQPGFVPGLMRVTKNFEPYNIKTFKYLNLDPQLMLNKAFKLPWNIPKVIANAAPITTDRWVIAGAFDNEGLICSQRFYGIWPTNIWPIEVIAALLNGPVANAYISTQRTSRHNQKHLIQEIPVPNFAPSQIQSIVALVEEYHRYRNQWLAENGQDQKFEQICRELIEQIDAEGLTAYNLPPRLERELLNYFAEYKRPGPINFERYYPKDFRPAIPWRIYISRQFQASTARSTLERLPVLNDPVISEMVENLE